MLTKLIPKLCPLMTLALATVGCGKKITDGTPSVPSRNTENQVIPSTYVLSLDGSQSSKKEYVLPKGANGFYIPNLIYVRAGSTLNKKVQITFDYNPSNPDDYQYKCVYIASPFADRMVIDKCTDFRGDVLNNVTDYDGFSLSKGDIMEIRFTGAPAPDLKVDAAFPNMNWI